jgi:hypothetical protein
MQLLATRRRLLRSLALAAASAGILVPVTDAAVADAASSAAGQTVSLVDAEPAVIGSGADSKSIDRLYRAYFLRAADPAGRTHWAGRLADGMPLAAISDEFAKSDEFRNRYGALSDADFVTLVYANVLERTADAAGHSHWLDRLARGASRGSVMLGFSDSEEFKASSGLVGSGADSRSIERLYRAYFLRAPDAAGLRHWTDQYAAGMSLARISDAFAASTEFVQRYGALSNGDFVDLVYRNVLGRVPDPAGHVHWTELLAAGMRRGAAMLGFSDSEEFKKKAGEVPTSETTPEPTAEKPTAPAGTYAFMQVQDGTPVQWPPCRTVYVVANFEGAPTGAEQALRDSLAAISAATKTSWVLEGATTERAPDMDYARPFRDLARYGDRYSPVLVSWAQSWPSDTQAVGIGGFGTITQNGVSKIVTGLVTLDPGFQPDHAGMANLLLHELGHVANLGHTQASDQVMYYSLRGYDAYQYGDEAGLAMVGSWDTDCSTTLAYAMSGSSGDGETGGYHLDH